MNLRKWRKRLWRYVLRCFGLVPVSDYERMKRGMRKTLARRRAGEAESLRRQIRNVRRQLHAAWTERVGKQDAKHDAIMKQLDGLFGEMCKIVPLRGGPSDYRWAYTMQIDMDWPGLRFLQGDRERADYLSHVAEKFVHESLMRLVDAPMPPEPPSYSRRRRLEYERRVGPDLF